LSDNLFYFSSTQLNWLSAHDFKLTFGKSNKPRELFPHFITAEKALQHEEIFLTFVLMYRLCCMGSFVIQVLL